MYSLIQPNRFAASKTIFFAKGNRYSKKLVRNNCSLCGPSVRVSHSFSSHLKTLQTRNSSLQTTLVLVNFCDNLKYRKCNVAINKSFHSGVSLYSEPLKPSSKVEETVQALKEASEQSHVPAESPPKQIKKTLKQRFIDEIIHYYHGFRLLFIDINISLKLLWKIMKGKSLTRREHKLLVRTVGDTFRIVPFSVFIIVPFLEFTLPLFIKIFPGMLPSTFQTATERDAKYKRALKIKLEMAKFLQETLDELPVISKGGHSCQTAKEFAEFFQKVRTSGGLSSSDEIMKFSKLFADEITLDTLPRPQLMALCRVLEINPIGPTNVLRFQLRLKVRSLTADDLMIQKEGIDALSQAELQAACRARGMRALGVSEERLIAQLSQWLDLSLNKKVPPSLLLLSQAFMLPDTIPTSEKLAQTISALPDAVGTRTKAVIGEREGKVDNKTKIELLKEEVKAIREERKELQEEEIKKAQARERAQDEELKDTAPTIVDKAITFPELRAALDNIKKGPISQGVETEISAKDINAIDTALDLLGKHKNDLMVEKEELEDLRQEMCEYQEDIADLEAVVKSDEVAETKAAKRLFTKVSNMISRVDDILEKLDHQKAKEKPADIRVELQSKASDGVIRVDELLAVLQKMELDKSRLERITQVLAKIDADKDGVVRLDNVLKILELVGNDNVPLKQDQLEEVISLVNKEEALELDEQIAKALKVKEEEKQEVKEMNEETEVDSSSNEPPPVTKPANSPHPIISESISKQNSPISEPKTPPSYKL